MRVMPLMNSRSLDKATALHELYGRVENVARELGGTSVRLMEPLRFLNAMVSSPRHENTPSLHAVMPNDFRAELTPTNPLSTPFVLGVNVRRIHRGFPKNGSYLHFLNGAWLVGQTPLSDDQIRRWVTVDGPPPAFL